MKNTKKITASLLAALALTAPCFAAGAAQPASEKTAQTAPLTKEDRERAELRTKTYKALLDLYHKKPKSRKAIQNAFGYAVFVDTSYSVGLLGAATAGAVPSTSTAAGKCS